MTIKQVTCAHCRHEFPVEVAEAGQREPCPNCGHEGILVEIEAHEVIRVTVLETIGLGPGDYVRNSSRRWREATEELEALSEPMASFDRTEVLQRQRRLREVFAGFPSLCDTAKFEGINANAVDGAVKQSADLALAHDVGNLAKHESLNRSMTGSAPSFAQPMAVHDAPDDRWRFELKIIHRSQKHDGVDLARRALAQWETLLMGWGLL